MNCSDPSPVAGVTLSPFSDTTEGANISFNCESGLEPQSEDVSVCSSNSSWVPDPAHRICSTSPPASSPPPSSKGIMVSYRPVMIIDYFITRLWSASVIS